MTFPRFTMIDSDHNDREIAINPAFVIQVEPESKTVTFVTLSLPPQTITYAVRMPFEQVVNRLSHAQRITAEVLQ